MTSRWPPSPYPDLPTTTAPLSPRSHRSHPLRSSSPTTATIRWIARLFAPSSTTYEKRSRSRSRSRSLSPDRRLSSDVESQASTLLDGEREQERESARGRVDARTISDAIIGLSDGLTVPFALTAGLSALGNTRVVIFAGLAELTAGAISMGLGGYLAASSEEESSRATLRETQSLVARSSEAAALSVQEIFAPYDLPASLTDDIAFHLAKSPNLVPFLMRFQHDVPEHTGSRAVSCALTIAGGYFLGGFLPLIPYFLVARDEVLRALWWSFAFMAVSLFSFGYGKTCFVSGWNGVDQMWAGTKGGLQMMVVGGTAAVCAMSLVRWFDSFAAS